MQGLEQQLALEREGSERDRGDDELIDLTPHIAVGSTAQQQASSRAELHQGGRWATAGHGRGEQPSLAPLIDLETEGQVPGLTAHTQGEQPFATGRQSPVLDWGAFHTPPRQQQQQNAQGAQTDPVQGTAVGTQDTAVGLPQLVPQLMQNQLGIAQQMRELQEKMAAGQTRYQVLEQQLAQERQTREQMQASIDQLSGQTADSTQTMGQVKELNVESLR